MEIETKELKNAQIHKKRKATITTVLTYTDLIHTWWRLQASCQSKRRVKILTSNKLMD